MVTFFVLTVFIGVRKQIRSVALELLNLVAQPSARQTVIAGDKCNENGTTSKNKSKTILYTVVGSENN